MDSPEFELSGSKRVFFESSELEMLICSGVNSDSDIISLLNRIQRINYDSEILIRYCAKRTGDQDLQISRLSSAIVLDYLGSTYSGRSHAIQNLKSDISNQSLIQIVELLDKIHFISSECLVDDQSYCLMISIIIDIVFPKITSIFNGLNYDETVILCGCLIDPDKLRIIREALCH